MFLTKTRTPRDPDKFPAAQLFLLAIVRVAEPISLTSIFPYAWKLVLHYNPDYEDNAGLYAGILISAFSLAEACTGMYWGGFSDRVGRKPVLLMGCAGTACSLLMVGFAPNLWFALAGRILGGLLNGNVGVVQTMVGELVQKPEHEPKAYAVMPFVWSLGTIIGPAIGGLFAEPTKTWPHVFPTGGLFDKLPYLLPNMICASLLVIAIMLGYFLLEETHPDKRPRTAGQPRRTSTVETPLLQTQGGNNNAPTNPATECYGTFDTVHTERDELWRVTSNGEWIEDPKKEPTDKALTRTVWMFVGALAIFTYHSMTYDHLLPIFLQDKRGDDISTFTSSASSYFAGGLGLSTQNVGVIMSVNGVIALFVQAIIFPILAEFFGTWRLLVLVTIGHPIAYFIVPYLVFLPSTLVYPGIYTCLTIRNLLSIIAYPLLLIMVKESAPSPLHLGKINGLAAAGGAACRSVASPIAGFLYDRSHDIRFTPLAWWASAIVAVVGAGQIPWLQREARNFNKVHVTAHGCLRRNSARKNEVVRIFVENESEDVRREGEGDEDGARLSEAETV